MMMNLENAHVFCINPNGVAEGCHFLTLVTCRPTLNPKPVNKKKRHRANSLPPSLEVYYETKEAKCKGKVFDLLATAPIRSLSEEFLKVPQRENLIRDACLSCISRITSSFDNANKKQRPNYNEGGRRSKSKPKLTSGVVLRSKMHKCMIQPLMPDPGFQCSGAALQMDGYVLSYFISEIKRSHTFRSSFIRRWSGESVDQVLKKGPKMLVFVALMKSPEYEVLDLLGNKMVNSNILFRRSLEHALSWLSTLGGAFSALGDLSSTYAEEAGHVSITQLRIAMKLDDPGIQSRCRLYAAISLLQRGYLKSCRDIVLKEYKYATSLSQESDPRLRRMCLGIWAKLQYHWRLVVAIDKKMLRSTKEGLKDIQTNAKYWNVYDLEENRRIVRYENDDS